MTMSPGRWDTPCHRWWGCLPSRTIIRAGSSPLTAAWCPPSSPASRFAWASLLRTTDSSSKARSSTPVLRRPWQAVPLLYTPRREPLWCPTLIAQFWSTQVPRPSPPTWAARIPPTSIRPSSSSLPPTTTYSEEETLPHHHLQNISTSFIARAIAKLSEPAALLPRRRHLSSLRITQQSFSNSRSCQGWPKTDRLLYRWSLRDVPPRKSREAALLEESRWKRRTWIRHILMTVKKCVSLANQSIHNSSCHFYHVHAFSRCFMQSLKHHVLFGVYEPL